MKKEGIRTLLFLYVIVCLSEINTLFAASVELPYKSDNGDASDSDSSTLVADSVSENADNSNSARINQSYTNTITPSDTERTPSETKELSSAECAVELAQPLEKRLRTKSMSNKYTQTETIVMQEDEEMEEVIDIESVTDANTAINTFQGTETDGLHSQKREELVNLLEKIVENTPHLARVAYSNEHRIIDLIIKFANTFVVKITRALNEVEKKTLWDVLQACSEGRAIDTGSAGKSPITNISLSYPMLSDPNPHINHALLSCYIPSQKDNIGLSLDGFGFMSNENIFRKYKIFHSIHRLTLKQIIICTNTLNLLSELTHLKELSFEVCVIALHADTADLALPKSLEKLEINSIDTDGLEWVLDRLNTFHNIKKIHISNIDFMSTNKVNSIKNIGNITSFTLRNVVFIGFPDFTFLKKMRALKELTMRNIFYSYAEKFEIEDLNKIKSNLAYLNPKIESKSSPKLKKRKIVHFADMVEENKGVGRHISPTAVNVDSRLYNDLGLCNIKAKKGNMHTICTAFAKMVQSGWVDSIEVEFSLNSTQDKLDVNAKTITFATDELLNSIQYIEFPFLHVRSIKEVCVTNSLKNPWENRIICAFTIGLFKCALINKVKSLEISSLISPLTIDTYKIVEINNRMPDLENLNLSNVVFVPPSTVPRNSDEESALQSYSEYIRDGIDQSFLKCKFIKSRSSLQMVCTVPNIA
ncbi:hypothetical protein NEIRO03_2474 [Nematocida sp. AWRm78]|nr:hypothetical protein NEIRO02_0793 [Nematocida sp. AWRm79]KAI5187186.1 hypothetical protein NEIRO03_2474 [Nematocida sp. AWRm78]